MYKIIHQNLQLISHFQFRDNYKIRHKFQLVVLIVITNLNNTTRVVLKFQHEKISLKMGCFFIQLFQILNSIKHIMI